MGEKSASQEADNDPESIEAERSTKGCLMRTSSNVDLELMQVEGESTEGYIRRIRDLQIAAAMKLTDAEQSLIAGRAHLAEVRAQDANFPEFVKAYDVVMGLSRAVGKARYEKQSIEFALSEVFHTANR